jgi:hypothetical protein
MFLDNGSPQDIDIGFLGGCDLHDAEAHLIGRLPAPFHK